MLDSNLKAQLKVYFEKIVSPIVLTASVDGNASSAQMLELLNEVAEQSDKLTVVTTGTAKNIPSFTVSKAGEDARITFSGLPMGHEMTSFILAILQASGYPPKVEQEIIERIRELDGKLHFQTFISLSCHNCPDVVQALNLMAALNPKVEHEMIDGALFQGLVDQHQVMAVPTVLLNGEAFGQGRMTVEEIVRAAQEQTGLADFGDPAILEGLGVLLKSYAEEARFTERGSQIAHAALFGWLLFGDLPDRWGWIGMGVIAVCGGTTAWLTSVAYGFNRYLAVGADRTHEALLVTLEVGAHIVTDEEVLIRRESERGARGVGERSAPGAFAGHPGAGADVVAEQVPGEGGQQQQRADREHQIRRLVDRRTGIRRGCSSHRADSLKGYCRSIGHLGPI